MNLTYYPYFRGRQFELLALRELLIKERLSNKIIPIVEPVKLSPTLLTTFKEYEGREKAIGLVRNPEFGDVARAMNALPKDKRKEFSKTFQAKNVFQAILQKGDIANVVEAFKKQMLADPSRWIAVFDSSQSLEESIRLANAGFRYGVHLIPDSTRFRRGIQGNKVLFRDCFIRQNRNIDYEKSPDEDFTDDHNFAEEENYVGTGDYSIIGKEYIDGGFAPYAVAIHIVYEDTVRSGVLKIRHFVSDSNDGYDDPAGKFMEAARKLRNWVYSSGIERSLGLDTLIDSYEKENYPGLGSLKKFAIMHHLELMGKILSR